MKKRCAGMFALLVACNAWAWGQDAWEYDLPEMGVAPNYAQVSILTSMCERHGGASHLGLQRYALSLPLADPRRSGGGGWMFNAQFDMKLTHVDAEGSLSLHRDELYQLSLPVALVRPLPGGNRLTLAVAPCLASDMSGSARGYDLAAFAEYKKKASDTLSYGVGIGLSPRFAQYGAVPFFSFEWKPSPEWEICLKGYRLSAMRHLSHGLSIGPCIEGVGGAWMVRTNRGDRIFRVRSLVAGLAGEYDFSKEGQRKRIIAASAGASLATSAQFCERGGAKDAYASRHYRPGLHAAIGVDFRF